jgi:hypothetical protein
MARKKNFEVELVPNDAGKSSVRERLLMTSILSLLAYGKGAPLRGMPLIKRRKKQ